MANLGYEFHEKLLQNLGEVIVGKDDVLTLLFSAMVAGGHVLVDCLGGVFDEGFVDLRDSVTESVEIDIFSHDMLLFFAVRKREICM